MPDSGETHAARPARTREEVAAIAYAGANSNAAGGVRRLIAAADAALAAAHNRQFERLMAATARAWSVRDSTVTVIDVTAARAHLGMPGPPTVQVEAGGFVAAWTALRLAGRAWAHAEAAHLEHTAVLRRRLAAVNSTTTPKEHTE